MSTTGPKLGSNVQIQQDPSSVSSDHSGSTPSSTPVNRPKDSKFHQQKLPGWSPLLTAGTIFPILFVSGGLFLLFGIILLSASNSVVEVFVDYTDCKRPDGVACSTLTVQPGFYSNYSRCACAVNFTVPRNIKPPVYVYYSLTSFHQNHRRYVKSRDDGQLAGFRFDKLSDDCDPYRSVTKSLTNNSASTKLWVAPCGMVPNSIFNDTFQLFPASANHSIAWVKDGIAWDADMNRKFKEVAYWNSSVKPENWPQPASDRSKTAYKGDGELAVWMHLSALPTFKKLHRIILTEVEAGPYSLHINYSFPVTNFGGTKRIILSTTSIIGGRNPSLGGLYITLGVIHLCLATFFVVVHLRSKKLKNEQDGMHGFGPGRPLLA